MNTKGYSENKVKILQRLKRISGQLSGIETMIQDERYCIDILNQTSAVKNAISSLEDEIFKDHITHCVPQCLDASGFEAIKDEILAVYKLKRK